MNGMSARKLIWSASAFSFVPVLAGLLSAPFCGMTAWWSLAAGGLVAAIAFGAFLEIAQAGVTRMSVKTAGPVIVSALAFIAVGAMGAACMEGINRLWIRPESFVAGLLAGTLFCQVALIVMSVKMKPARS